MSELNDPVQKLTLLVKVNKLRKTFYKCGSVAVCQCGDMRCSSAYRRLTAPCLQVRLASTDYDVQQDRVRDQSGKQDETEL